MTLIQKLPVDVCIMIRVSALLVIGLKPINNYELTNYAHISMKSINLNNTRKIMRTPIN